MFNSKRNCVSVLKRFPRKRRGVKSTARRKNRRNARIGPGKANPYIGLFPFAKTLPNTAQELAVIAAIIA